MTEDEFDKLVLAKQICQTQTISDFTSIWQVGRQVCSMFTFKVRLQEFRWLGAQDPGLVNRESIKVTKLQREFIFFHHF